jgi:hypothetical protein
MKARQKAVRLPELNCALISPLRSWLVNRIVSSIRLGWAPKTKPRFGNPVLPDPPRIIGTLK